MRLRLPTFNGSAWHCDVAVDTFRDEGLRELKIDDDGKTRVASLTWSEETAIDRKSSSPKNSFLTNLRISTGGDVGWDDDDTPLVAIHSKYWIVNHTGKRLRYDWVVCHS